MDAVGRNDHPPGGDFVAHLLGGQVRLALGDPAHFGSDGSKPRVFELSHRRKTGRWNPGLVRFVVGFKSGPAHPVAGHEIPGRLRGRLGHSRRVGRRERKSARDSGRNSSRGGKACRTCPCAGGRCISPQRRQRKRECCEICFDAASRSRCRHEKDSSGVPCAACILAVQVGIATS